MLDLLKVHGEIFELLSLKRKQNPDLRFTLRKSNHASKLEQGFWFYGNEDYLAVSFWSGMDWKNKTPNIIYVINSEGISYLEINVSDSDIKRGYVEKYLIKEIGFEVLGRKYRKYYSNNEFGYINVLDNFLEGDKLQIDNIIRSTWSLHFPVLENTRRKSLTNIEGAINFIDREEFYKNYSKVKWYRANKRKNEENEEYGIKEDNPNKLLFIEISGFGNINQVEINIANKKNKWIFITGENGAGKTNLLRAIATFLGNRNLTNSEIKITDEPRLVFNVKAKLLFKNAIIDFERTENDESKSKKKPIVQGLAMYGPYRLDIVNDKISKSVFLNELKKDGSFKSLFKTSSALLSIDKQFEFWRKGTIREKDFFEKRKYYIKSVLTDILPELVDIRFQGDFLPNKTQYVFRNSNSFEEFNSTWSELSSGNKSMISMLGDILIRFYHQQKDILDPSEFRGIVIIDEIDLHLHPKAQKDLVVNLSKTFPGIQFIVTTHSPIPLLGAPVDCVFFNVRRVENDVKVQRLFQIEKYIGELLPNQLFTSDLFGLDSLCSIQNVDKSNIYTGSTMSNFIEFKELSAKNNLKHPNDNAFIEKLKTRLK